MITKAMSLMCPSATASVHKSPKNTNPRLVQNQKPCDWLNTLIFLKSFPRSAEIPLTQRSKLPPARWRRAWTFGYARARAGRSRLVLLPPTANGSRARCGSKTTSSKARAASISSCPPLAVVRAARAQLTRGPRWCDADSASLPSCNRPMARTLTRSASPPHSTTTPLS